MVFGLFVFGWLFFVKFKDNFDDFRVPVDVEKVKHNTSADGDKLVDELDGLPQRRLLEIVKGYFDKRNGNNAKEPERNQDQYAV